AVSALYERVFHPAPQRSARVLDRVRGQLGDSIAWLEERAPASGCLFGERPSHGDVAVGTALCFAREAHPDLVDLATAPRLAAWTRRLDARPEFVKTYLALDPPN